jgi:ribosome-binding protein aMBF1 (putative translation factor)
MRASKLSDEAIADIIANAIKRRETLSQRQMAKKHGISVQWVIEIVAGTAYPGKKKNGKHPE